MVAVPLSSQSGRWLQQSPRPPRPDHDAESTRAAKGRVHKLPGKARHAVAVERGATDAVAHGATDGAGRTDPHATGRGDTPHSASRLSRDELLAELERRDIAVREAPTALDDPSDGATDSGDAKAGSDSANDSQGKPRDRSGNDVDEDDFRRFKKFVKSGRLVGTALGTASGIYKSLSYPWPEEFAVFGWMVAICTGASLGSLAVPAFVVGHMPGVTAWTIGVWLWYNAFTI